MSDARNVDFGIGWGGMGSLLKVPRYIVVAWAFTLAMSFLSICFYLAPINELLSILFFFHVPVYAVLTVKACVIKEGERYL